MAINQYEYDGYVYVRENGTRYKTSWLSSTFKKFLKQNGLRQIRFHDLRHTCATMLRHTGVPMEDIQKFPGILPSRQRKESMPISMTRGIVKKRLNQYLSWYEILYNENPTLEEFERLVFSQYLKNTDNNT